MKITSTIARYVLGLTIYSLRPERLSPFHPSDASAPAGQPVLRRACGLSLCGPHFRAPVGLWTCFSYSPVPLALTLIGPVILTLPHLDESERHCARGHRNHLLVVGRSAFAGIFRGQVQ
jgi:hypothetical protein